MKNIRTPVYEMRFLRTKDKSYRRHFTRGVPVLGENGAILYWVGTCTDIHVHKEAEEIVRNSQQMLEARITLLPSASYQRKTRPM